MIHSEIGSKNPEKIVIIMHGYGSNKDDMSYVAMDMVNKSQIIKDKVLFLSLDAPFSFEYDPSGNARQWFSLMSRDEDFVYQGLDKAYIILIEYINEMLQKYNLSYGDLFLSGFSQGAMLSLHTGIKIGKKLSGIVYFSGTLARKDDVLKNSIINQDICMIHGDKDDVLPFTYSKIAHKALIEAGWAADLHIIKDMPHTINDECIKIATKFIEKKI
ncbi:alpha/beta hydrolase [Candidatus Deianiraea vastatrix]|uniref:Phospholipase n=1 Tax=Candidatus Deianiraea vastatrix TaxID=2163644 RepID=A0A5B8XG18_9RICK|nr:hypothetical protein [Candidatus Deianiraea vastatrix]QED22917.1 Putative phospholipase [Candidatus Deianiraea vastatrix]